MTSEQLKRLIHPESPKKRQDVLIYLEKTNSTYSDEYKADGEVASWPVLNLSPKMN